MNHHAEHILEKLKARGKKQTRVRTLIVSRLAELKKPCDAVSLLEFLMTKGIVVNKTTVYRELGFLVGEGAALEISFGDGRQRYEIAGLPHHHHIVCTNCETVEDVYADEGLEAFEKKVARRASFLITGHSLEFFGLCRNCR